MPNGTPRLRHAEPQPAPPPAPIYEPTPTKRDLASWWKQFSKRANTRKEEAKEQEARGIFGVPLITSIPYANVAISLFNETGESYIYGYVPIVVAKCGVFLKEKATDVEGIFRLPGSEKRIKELKVAFDTPPRWGKGLDWTGYTVHDAANILRRYFNQLPEPIIPLQHYDAFRGPLRGHQAEAVGFIEGQEPSVGGFDPDAAVRVYQHLIKELPSLNRQLLLYILDLLAVFAAKSDVNKMTTSNLATIFQPGILSHPQHHMVPQEYRLNQDVLIFLIDNQDHFLIGMEGTAVDENTVKHVESGPSTPQAKTPTTPGRKQTGLGRSASTSSSIGAESLRKLGGIRRNVSTSSRHSRQSGAIPSPSTPTASGVHRSNTVPSKKSPAIGSTRFSREKHSDPPTPAPEEAKAPTNLQKVHDENMAPPEQPAQNVPVVEKNVPVVEKNVPVVEKMNVPVVEKMNVVKPSAAQNPAHPPPVEAVSEGRKEPVPAGNVQSPLPAEQLMPPPTLPSQGERSPMVTPIREKSEFMEAPLGEASPTEPTQTGRTFTQILAKVSPSNDERKDGRKPNKLQKKPRVPSSANPSAHSSTHSLSAPFISSEAPPSPLPLPQVLGGYPFNGSKDAFPSGQDVASRQSGATLKPQRSPSPSFKSHSTAAENSEAEPGDDGHGGKEEKKSFWKSYRRGESKATVTPGQYEIGQNAGAEKSMSSFSSGSGWGRRSLQLDHQQGSESSRVGQDGEAKDAEKRNMFGWFSEKRRERKEREAEKQRAKSPPGTSVELGRNFVQSDEGMAARGRSMDVPRAVEKKESSDATPTGASPQVHVADGDFSKP